MTHWKKAFKSDYLSSSDIDGIDLNLTISHVMYKECLTQSGKKYCNVAYFNETKLDSKGNFLSGYKPMILNVTNSKIVKKFSGNKTQLEDWGNIPVSIYVDSNVRFAGDTVEGLRIRTAQSKPKPKLTPLTDDNIPKVVAWMKEGNKSIGDLKKHYSFNANVEAEILKQI